MHEIFDLVIVWQVIGTSELIVRPGLINVDFADVREIIANSGTALIGIGTGTGKVRVRRSSHHTPPLLPHCLRIGRFRTNRSESLTSTLSPEDVSMSIWTHGNHLMAAGNGWPIPAFLQGNWPIAVLCREQPFPGNAVSGEVSRRRETIVRGLNHCHISRIFATSGLFHPTNVCLLLPPRQASFIRS